VWRLGMRFRVMPGRWMRKLTLRGNHRLPCSNAAPSLTALQAAVWKCAASTKCRNRSRASWWASLGRILVVVLEEESSGIPATNYHPTVTRNLPLVIHNQSELDQSGEVLLQGKTCPTPHSSVKACPAVFSLNWAAGVLAVRQLAIAEIVGEDKDDVRLLARRDVSSVTRQLSIHSHTDFVTHFL
jgi:hypothetical protein